MTYVKKIVCLANSIRPGGTCVAGREIVSEGNQEIITERWVRPISKGRGGGISLSQRKYNDDKEVQVLDIIEIPMIEPVPDGHQSENHLIDDSFPWKKTGKADWATLKTLVEPLNGPLWVNKDSTKGGKNDIIKGDDVSDISSSLILIGPIDIRIMFSTTERGKRVVRADFHAAGHDYSIIVTDPKVKAYSAKDFSLENAIICVSLAEKLEATGKTSKLVATIFTENGPF